MAKLKVVHYINPVLCSDWWRRKADYPAELRVGEIVGPGMALTQNFKDEAEIIATIVCGDSYFNENLDKAKAEILAMVKRAESWIYSSQDLHLTQDVTVLLVVQSQQQFRKNLESQLLQVCM